MKKGIGKVRPEDFVVDRLKETLAGFDLSIQLMAFLLGFLFPQLKVGQIDVLVYGICTSKKIQT